MPLFSKSMHAADASLSAGSGRTDGPALKL